MSEKRSIRSWIPVILSLLLLTGTLTVFRACGPKEDGTWMHCHSAQNDIVIAAAILFVVFSAAAVIKNKMLSGVFHIVGIAGSLIVILIPGILVHMCMMDTMRCYEFMQPFARVMGVLLILSAVINLIFANKK